MALWLCDLMALWPWLMSVPLPELLIYVIQLLECSIEHVKHAVNMADVHESEYNECEEAGTDSGNEVNFYSDYMVYIYDNDSESNECEENGGGYLSSESDYAGKLGGDFGRTNLLNAIRQRLSCFVYYV